MGSGYLFLRDYLEFNLASSRWLGEVVVVAAGEVATGLAH
jgi:hypothetical protein